jgi:hypothetical protein
MSDHARRVFVLDKADDYLRLALPAAFANPGSAQVIESTLLRLPGVRSAMLDQRRARLSVHFDQIACSHRQLALVLKGILDEALAAARQAPPQAESVPAGGAPLDARLEQWRSRAMQWLRYANEKALAASHAMQAQLIRPQSGVAPVAPAGNVTPWQRVFNPALFNERSAINFANDIVAFYLIRVHWNQITKYWLPFPLRHADAWLTVFYLTFLLVRYRKRNAGPAAAPALPPPAAAAADAVVEAT